MSQVSQVEAGSNASSRGSKDAANTQASEERFSTLLSRDAYTFAQMRTERAGPRTFSALCFRGWKRD
jgi:hypothetical protein